MPHRTAPRLLAWMLVAALLALAAAVSQAAPAPVGHFTRQAAIASAHLSPAGTRLALRQRAEGGRVVLVVKTLSTGDTKLLAGFDDADITSVRWINDERLVYQAFQDGPEVKEDGAGTFASNHDGSAHRLLIAWRYANRQTGITSRTLPYGWFVHSTLDDGSDDVFVHRVVRGTGGDVKESQLARLNTLTGELRSLSEGMPEYTSRWLTDAQGEPRVVSAYRDGRHKVYWRDPKDPRWKLVGDYAQLAGDGLHPVHVDADGQLIVDAAVGRDTSAYYRFDPQARRLTEEPIVALQGFDVSEGKLVVDTRSHRMVGLHFTADRPMSYWFDDRLHAVQKGIDAALPGRFNRLECGRCESTTTFLVRSISDRQPGEYFVFDSAKGSLQEIGAVRPWIDERTQARRSFHRVAARDGQPMPLYVTHPAGADDKALPAVVLVHGGPWMRGSDLGWDAEAQFFASRGYRVLQPEFRGSTGYGFKHFQLSWKQWGRTMQDDLVDAVDWAVKKGLVDGKRVCIMGRGYGGYAALMAPIRSPGAFRCAASFAGVTDLDFLYSIHWSDFSEQYKDYGMPTVIGDRSKDAALLASASPLARVAEIKVPVLLAHGSRDRRVPIEHANAFAAAARRAGVDIEQVNYNDEGHGWYWSKDHSDFLLRTEKLMKRTLESEKSTLASE